MKSNCDLGEIAAVLRSANRFVVMSHVRPDGDAYGCELAMALCLRELGKDVTVWNEDGMLDRYRFMPGSELVARPSLEPQEFEVAICLDTAVQDRIGTCWGAVRHAGCWINIDHHITNNHYGDLAYVDAAAPAAGQILYELFAGHGLPLTREMAANLYVAISTDTGSSTTARTYEIGAELVRLGVDVGGLSQQVYESYPRRRIELLRELLNVLRMSAGDRVASFGLDRATAERVGALPEDNEGLIDTIRAIEGVDVAAFFEEMEGGRVRVSLRSKRASVDVSRVCAQFGGGGHTLAAGARVAGSLREVETKVLLAIEHELART
jgi:phosphoesterase RecJ-like protein